MRRIVLSIALVAATAFPAEAAPAMPSAGAAPASLVVTEAFTYLPGGDNIGGGLDGSTGPLVVPRGTDVLYVNAETLALDPHSITSTGCAGPTPEPCWFDTSDPRPQAPGEYAIVETSDLEAGTYRFFCAVHPVMRGTMVVA